MEESPEPREGHSPSRSLEPEEARPAFLPQAILSELGLRTGDPKEVVWDAFLHSFGEILHRTARYAAP